MFPYSLRDHGRAWLNALPFLLRYNLPNMNAKLKNDITCFRQSKDEMLYEGWERFKELLRKCPLNRFQHWT
ncbi:pentatricopeptide repeat-containing protein chloroplastic-like [Gossypium australe]|uniref:Pentatricopeptide repeat-containing protein chloroplastic-like n=1 Tax=Gossypium australe TaxID=47621 RepID=A0A5B6VB91_9ROSI|nr:pentatricopeptide repeat-containing protein chloroplastic-like [Gossypium australe]